MKRALLFVAALLMAQAAFTQTITTFDVPGATDTSPVAINLSGTIAGQFSDATGRHGFLRDPVTTTITTFNSPTAPRVAVIGMNDSGAVVGNQLGLYYVTGFMRDSLGNFTDIALPGSVQTAALSINNIGQVTGYWFDSSRTQQHGFVWNSSSNAYTSFDVPGSTGTWPNTINNNGQVVGTYYGAISSLYPFGKPHGFFRDANGTITTFDAPVAYTSMQVNSIDDNQEIIGMYTTDNSATYHGFVRNEKNGTESSFDADPTAGSTFPWGINSGTIVGEFLPAGLGSATGFVNPGMGSGTFTSFTVTGATWTSPDSINANGAICGSYIIEASFAGAHHGFIRQPGAAQQVARSLTA